jgi:nitrate/nitrite-specific signal transduction histidine kinase
MYGPNRSFHRQVGEVVSAVSIRIPVGTAYASAHQITIRLTIILLVLLATIFLAHAWLSRNLVTVPLKDLSGRVRAIAGDPDLLGGEIPPPSARELRQLADAFNGMSRSLKAGVDDLEDRVAERTQELREALANVRTLAGLLPICSRCKKIRNDQGFWQQVEAYVAEHSEAEFSHGICPDCMQVLYPEFTKDQNG